MTAPIIRWRWRMIGSSTVLHAAEPAGRAYVPACSYSGDETVLDVDGQGKTFERCLACIKAISKP